MKTAIYPGTFNPWTKGHQDILERALTIFDTVILVVANNPEKEIDAKFIKWTLHPVVEMFNGRVSVSICTGLVSKYKMPIIRGVRSGDWEYEQNLAVWNKELGVETFFLCPDPAISHISSSALRLLHDAGQSVQKYVGGLFSFERWKQGKIPNDVIFAGKIAVGKSTWLNKQNRRVIDADVRFWEHFDAVSCDAELHGTLKENLKYAIEQDQEQEYNRLLGVAAYHVNWDALFPFGYSHEASALGVWWDYIPHKVLARFRIMELDTDYNQRIENIEKRKLSMEYVTKLDKLYKVPPVCDEIIDISVIKDVTVL